MELVSAAERIAVWRTRIDEFATRIMVDGGGPETIVALRCLGDEARMQDAGPCIQVIDDLIVKLEEDLQRGLDHLFTVGVGQLQNSYEPGREASPKKVASVPLCEDTELVGDFVVEAREHLSDIEGQMLTLERDPSDMEVLHAVFRAFHTIKGLAGFLDFAVVQTVAHEVETLLDLARNEKLVIHPSIVDVVLESGDFILGELAAIERALNSETMVETSDPDALAAKIRQLSAPLPNGTAHGLTIAADACFAGRSASSEPPITTNITISCGLSCLCIPCVAACADMIVIVNAWARLDHAP
jgi:two-component system chemotaxis sensor kinase CheA